MTDRIGTPKHDHGAPGAGGPALHPDQVTIGDGLDKSGQVSPRDLITNSSETISVPGDFSTIQAAINSVPYIVRHQIDIEIDETEGPFDEDIVIPAIISEGSNDDSQGPDSALRITTSGGGGVEVDSMLITNAVGSFAIQIQNMVATQSNPWDDEGAAWGVYGVGSVQLNGCGIGGAAADHDTRAGVTKGIDLRLKNFDHGTDLVKIGWTIKAGGHLHADSTSGNVTSELFRPAAGPVHFDGSSSATSDGSLVRQASNMAGYGFDFDSKTLFGVDGTDRRMTTGYRGFHSTPSDLSNDTGEVGWQRRIHNGNDGNPEGCYEWDPDNSEWIGLGNASGTTIVP